MEEREGEGEKERRGRGQGRRGAPICANADLCPEGVWLAEKIIEPC